MPSRPQWIRFFYPAFFAAVSAYNAAVAGAYIRALCYYWQVNNCVGIEDDQDAMMRICGTDKEDWDKHGSTVFGKLFILDGNGLWQQKRAKEEWSRAIEYSNKSSEKGKLGAYKRWHGNA